MLVAIVKGVVPQALKQGWLGDPALVLCFGFRPLEHGPVHFDAF